MMIQHILHFLYPPACMSCDAWISENIAFCEPCELLIKPVVSLRLAITSKIVMPVYAGGAYKEPLRKLVIKKFSQDLRSSKLLGSLMAEKLTQYKHEFDVIVPVPLHWTRYSQRGYNQALVMAQTIGKNLHKPVLRFLTRQRRTMFQSRLKEQDRMQNVKDAFSVHPWYDWQRLNPIKGQRVLIVDDLCTTGSTLKSVGKVIAKQKPASISAIVGCRAI